VTGSVKNLTSSALLARQSVPQLEEPRSRRVAGTTLAPDTVRFFEEEQLNIHQLTLTSQHLHQQVQVQAAAL